MPYLIFIIVCMIIGSFFPRFMHVLFVGFSAVAVAFVIWCSIHYGWFV